MYLGIGGVLAPEGEVQDGQPSGQGSYGVVISRGIYVVFHSFGPGNMLDQDNR